MKRNTRWRLFRWLCLPLFLLFLLASSRAGAAMSGMPVSTDPEPIWPAHPQNGLPDPSGHTSVQSHSGWGPSWPTSWRPLATTSSRWLYAVPSTTPSHIHRQPNALWIPGPAWQAAPPATFQPRYPVAGYVPPIHPHQPQLGRPQAYAPILGAPSRQRLSLRPGAPR